MTVHRCLKDGSTEFSISGKTTCCSQKDVKRNCCEIKTRCCTVSVLYSKLNYTGEKAASFENDFIVSPIVQEIPYLFSNVPTNFSSVDYNPPPKDVSIHFFSQLLI